MPDNQLVNQLAGLCGISSEYLDSEGLPVTITPENKVPPLEAMGFDLSSKQSIKKAIDLKSREKWNQTIPTVVVLHQNKSFAINIRLSEKKLPENFNVTVTLEYGEVRIFQRDINDLTVIEKSKISKDRKVCLSLPLPEDLPMGYHQPGY